MCVRPQLAKVLEQSNKFENRSNTALPKAVKQGKATSRKRAAPWLGGPGVKIQNKTEEK
jgi:hypothetical protein